MVLKERNLLLNKGVMYEACIETMLYFHYLKRSDVCSFFIVKFITEAFTWTSFELNIEVLSFLLLAMCLRLTLHFIRNCS
jgi:hypothetical protein